MTNYDPAKIEPKWQAVWAKNNLYKTPTSGKKKYVLDMFPYPSGATMHVGHLEGYVGTDVLSRYFRMKGFSVLHPMGWDAFGLPAENYAIKTGVAPQKSIPENIRTFKRQLINSGLSYDWDRELDTSDPNYYKWTQWLFIQLFKKGLAYKKLAPVNWCPKDETVLANEQVVDGQCERCGSAVVQKDTEQWFFKITAYADRLIADLKDLDWPPEVKTQQINWIGKKEGSLIKFGDIEIFTTRPDTILGATFVVLSPNHPLAHKVKSVINPATKKAIPVFVDEYVLDTVGTGAIMGVPAYDDRDRVFAEKNNLPIVEALLIKENYGEKMVTYHLRDWLISRQRYWGCPIPMIYCQKCEWQPVPEADLPVELPTDVDFQPHGESPIARSKSFQEKVRCPHCGGPGRREVDTMDTYVDSSWYFLRFADPNNNKEFVSRESLATWLPVDTYVGGGHVVQHLLFARFFWKALFDLELIEKSLGDEPFQKLRAPGWILGPDSRKMSKRWNNIITPDDVVLKYGADTLRVYELFLGPFSAMKPWSVASVSGVYRFLKRVNSLFNTHQQSNTVSAISQLVAKVGEDIENFRFNTAIAAMMEYVKNPAIDWENFLVLLAPFAPHLAEELWHALGHANSIHLERWPESDTSTLISLSSLIVVTVNSKPRGTIQGDVLSEQEAVLKAQSLDSVAKYLTGKVIKRIVYVPGKIVNFVTEP